ncbi:MAG: thioredoxin fold domain-containing protein [candidate division WOR-3 bacterium]|nr:MAG: thioredoxin fold domain-containing protein [candidate division WOR-3 bacterium]
MNSQFLLITVTIVVCLFIPLNPGFCEKTNTPQGTKKLDEIHNIVQTIVQHIRDQNTEKALAFMMDMQNLWQAFTGYHEETFAGELNPPDGMDELLSGITGDIGELEHNLKAGNFSESLGKAQVLLDAITSLNKKMSLPILFDFTGPKCKSCKVMKARLTEVAPDFTGKVRIVLVDVNVQKDFTRKFKIMLIPTLIFIDKTGTEISRHVGQMEEPAIRAELADLMERSGPEKR